jgi:methylated-DNA-[protein]-cysteine S-methyltransferase
MKNIFFYQTDIGKIGIAESENVITNVYFQGEALPENVVVEETNILKEAGKQLNNYFLGRQMTFTLPLAPVGTEFMTSVWKSLQAIPYGETRSYKEIAQSIGNPKASRAVGLANNRNPIPIFIPCHRVIGSNGKLVGFRSGLETKQYLLELEKRYKN